MKWFVAIVVALFIFVCVVYLYRALETERRLTPDVTNSDEWRLAVKEAAAEARGYGFVEFIGAIGLFCVLSVVMVHFRSPRQSWLRTLLSAFVALVMTVAGFGYWMDVVFRSRVSNATLPISSFGPLFYTGASAVAITIICLLVTERVHVWSVR
jgi:hypothetical protein